MTLPLTSFASKITNFLMGGFFDSPLVEKAVLSAALWAVAFAAPPFAEDLWNPHKKHGRLSYFVFFRLELLCFS